MSWYMRLKLAFSLIGIALFIWGVRTDDRWIRWAAIVFLAASVLMRLVPKRMRGETLPPSPPPEAR